VRHNLLRVGRQPGSESDFLALEPARVHASTPQGLNLKLSIGNADGPEQRNTHVRCGDQLRLVLYPSL
jgi:hypothetical protein